MQTSLHKPLEPANWLEVVAEQAGKLRFGLVQIVVHDGRVGSRLQLASEQECEAELELRPSGLPRSAATDLLDKAEKAIFTRAQISF